MALVNTAAVKKIEFEDDGDWYELRQQVGFVAHKLGESGSFTTQEIMDYSPKGDISTFIKSFPAAEYQARKNATRILVRLANWSHSEPISFENVIRIPTHQADVILEAIAALEKAALPFRKQPKAKADD